MRRILCFLSRRRWSLKDHIIVTFCCGLTGIIRFWVAFGSNRESLIVGFIVGAVLGFALFGTMFLDQLFPPRTHRTQIIKNVTLGPGAKLVQVA